MASRAKGDQQYKKIIIGLFVWLLFSAAALAGEFEDAAAAYLKNDYATALKLFRPVAERGDASAQFILGMMYALGQGVAEDHKEAVKWYRLAAAQGNAAGQTNLGVMYATGQGVAQDYTRTHMWANLAAA